MEMEAEKRQGETYRKQGGSSSTKKGNQPKGKQNEENEKQMCIVFKAITSNFEVQDHDDRLPFVNDNLVTRFLPTVVKFRIYAVWNLLHILNTFHIHTLTTTTIKLQNTKIFFICKLENQ